DTATTEIYTLSLHDALPISAVHPDFNADDSVRRVGLREAVVDIGAQGVQRQLPLQIPLAAGDFRAVQPPGHAHLDALAAEALRALDGLAHGAPESHALFELQRDRLAHELGVHLRFVHFLDIDEDFALGLGCQFLLELFDLRPLAADDEPGARRVDGDAQLGSARALDLDRADAGRFQPLLEHLLQIEVLVQQLGVVGGGKPSRTPVLGDAQPESVGMNFLTHALNLPIPAPAHSCRRP